MRNVTKLFAMGFVVLATVSSLAAENQFTTAHGVTVVRAFDHVPPTSRIIICTDSKRVKFEEVQNFISEYLWDKNYQLFDGFEFDSSDIDDVTLAYVGEPISYDTGNTCLGKFSELKDFAIDRSMNEPRYTDGSSLSPSLPKGKFQLPIVYATSVQDFPDTRSHLYVGLCFSQEMPCLDGVLPSLFGLQSDFCFQVETCR